MLIVGSLDRAKMLAGLLEPLTPGKAMFELESSRSFLTVTGASVVVPFFCIRCPTTLWT